MAALSPKRADDYAAVSQTAAGGSYLPAAVPRRAALVFALAALLAALLYSSLILPFLGVPEIFQVSEGREGVVVDEILRSGEWILPLRHGTVVPSKPIFYHWLAASLSIILNRDDEFLLRLPSMLAAALLLAVLCFVFARTNYHLHPGGAGSAARAGAAVAAMLALSLGYIRLATDARVDMVFLALSIGAVLVLYEPLVLAAASQDGAKKVQNSPLSTRRLMVFSILTGCSILAKGPLGLVIPLLVVVPYSVLAGGPRAIKWYWHPVILACVLIPLPWYICAALKGSSSFIARQLFFENVGRFLGAAGISKKPLYFYLPHLFEQAAPLAEMLALFAAAGIFCAEIRAITRRVLGSLEKIETAQINFSLIWILNLFLFFTAASGKRASYLVAIIPPLAILAGLLLRRILPVLLAAAVIPRFAKAAGWLLWSLFPVTAALALAASAVSGPPTAETAAVQRTALALAGVISEAPLRILLYLTAFSGCGAGCWLLGVKQNRLFPLAQSLTVFWAMIIFLLVPLVQSVRGVTHGYKDFALQVFSAAPAAEKLRFIKRDSDESFDGFFFYVKRRIELIDPDAAPQEPGYYLARVSWLEAQGESWRRRTDILLSGGRLVDSAENRVLLFRLNNPVPPPAELPRQAEQSGLEGKSG